LHSRHPELARGRGDDVCEVRITDPLHESRLASRLEGVERLLSVGGHDDVETGTLEDLEDRLSKVDRDPRFLMLSTTAPPRPQGRRDSF
jgi:hypothetical protein